MALYLIGDIYMKWENQRIYLKNYELRESLCDN
jgi:hypothetical protein